MKSTLRSIFTFAAILLCSSAMKAQLTGTITVPNATYPDLAAALTALNTQGVGAGGVTINLAAGNPQIAPAGGYRIGSTVLNASASATQTVTVNGNNNIIYAQTGTKGTAAGGDAIFWLRGTDYLTVDGFTLNEVPGNNDSTRAMEYGIAIVNLNAAAPFDGSYNNTIRNCTIVLNKNIPTLSSGIYSAHRVLDSARALTITSAAVDLHSSNKYYSNTIRNVVNGINLNGFGASSPYTLFDHFNDIGGTSSATGNTITNFGGTVYSSVGAINAFNQDSTNISFNTINDSLGAGGVLPTGGVWGIYPTGDTSTFTVNNNNITMAGASSSTSNFVYGIYANTRGVVLTAQNNNIYVAQATGSASPLYGLYFNASRNLTAANNTITINQSANGTVAPIITSGVGNINITGNTIKTINPVAVTGTHYQIYSSAGSVLLNITGNNMRSMNLRTSGTNYMIYASATSTTETVNNNIIDSITYTTTAGNDIYAINISNSTNAVTANGNRVTNLTRGGSGTLYGIYNLGSPGSSTSNINNNVLANFTTAGSGNLAGIYYNTATGHNHNFANDSIYNFTSGGNAATVYGIYCVSGNNNVINNNYIANLATGNSTLYGIYTSGGTSSTAGSIGNNIISGLLSSGTNMYGLYLTDATNTNISANAIYNVATTTTSTSGRSVGIFVSTATRAALYNNIISDIKASTASTTSPVYGIYLSGGTTLNAYFNTINLTPTSTATNFGATGLYYASGITTFDLRNNIIRVVATPTGTGTVVALRRSSGTANVAPANLAATSNANIYYVPTAANSYLYGESTTTTMVNGFNLTNDPGFNTSCGLYKQFMVPRETVSFTENNLTQIGTTATFAPTGSSFAESKAVATTAPAITTDYAGTTRSNPADIGALQFAGTATADVAGPAITYTPLPLQTYCNAVLPTFTATITDASGVNNAAGTAPRVYFRKSTEANAFGGANNSTFNGWKWTEATLSGTTYTFTIDYSLLNTPINPNDSIVYFVVAQDNAATPNVSSRFANFAACPASVNLTAAAGPTTALPAHNSYKILPVPPLVVSSSSPTVCFSGSVTLSLANAPLTSPIQWQSDNNGNLVFADIPGATGTSYTTPTITIGTNYRVQLYCGTTVIATSNVVNVAVQTPTIVSTTPATRCGFGTASLSATANSGATTRWYTAATGGTALFTGSPFVTPIVSGTTTFYVSAYIAATNCESARTPVTVTVTAPTPVVASSPQAAGICLGGFAIINATSTNAAYQYSWSSGQNTATFSDNPTNTTKYIVTATDPVTGCVARDSVTVIVNIPVATITPAGSTSLCPGGSVVLNANTGTNFSYEWFLGGVSIPGATGAAYTASVSGSYTVKVTNPATTCFTTSTATIVTINPLPSATITPVGNLNLCSGSTLTLTGPAGTGYTYQWRNGTNLITTGGTSISYGATTAGSYTLIVTANGCSSTSLPANVTIQPLPVTTFTPATAASGCDSVMLITNNPGVTYQWNYNGAPIIGATNPVYAARLSGNYSLTNISTANGCAATTPNVAITVNPTPVGTITYNSPLTFCQGGAVVLNTFGGANQLYIWKRGGDTILGAVDPSYIADTTGVYTVAVANSATGCSRTSSSVVVKVNPKPTPVAVYNAATNQLSTTVPFILYQWHLNTQPIGGALQRFYTPRESGAYSVTVTDSNGCTNTSAIVFANSVGVENTPLGAAVKIYPNPTKGMLYIKAPAKVNLSLRDVTGKTILKSENETELNLEQLANGTYLLYIKDESGHLIRVEKVTKSDN